MRVMDPKHYQYPVDYLNAIANDTKPKRNNLLFFVIGGGTLVVAAAIFLILGSLTNRTAATLPTAYLRVDALATTTSSYQSTIRSSQLRAINIDLGNYLVSTKAALANQLKQQNTDPAKLDKSLQTTQAAATKDITEQLDDAKLNAVFDRTYAREMSYQLEKVAIMLTSASKATSRSSAKTALSTARTNLESVKKQLDDFSTAATT